VNDQTNSHIAFEENMNQSNIYVAVKMSAINYQDLLQSISLDGIKIE
jgi:hypothetical protein